MFLKYSGFFFLHLSFFVLVYVFLGASKSLVDMMNTMQALQLFDNGDYMVIYGDTKINSWKDAPQYLWSNFDVDSRFLLS